MASRAVDCLPRFPGFPALKTVCRQWRSSTLISFPTFRSELTEIQQAHGFHYLSQSQTILQITRLKNCSPKFVAQG